mmetsp:Transcript_83188/g.174136  ORF Transcript_83188/g.174136 Transcript_83188/m.174136 type:complete len:208 (+) Transcript_83188:969-1592(+)
MSTKSQSTCSSMNWANLDIVSTSPPATWMPKHFSLSCRLSKDSSGAAPSKMLPARAISPTVTSQPSLTQRRLKGRFPTVVRGAKMLLPLTSRGLMSGWTIAPSGVSEPPLQYFCQAFATSVLLEKSNNFFLSFPTVSKEKMLVSPGGWPTLGIFFTHSDSGVTTTPSLSTFLRSCTCPWYRQFRPAGQTPSRARTGHGCSMSGSLPS